MYRFYNARILTMANPDKPDIFMGTVYVQDDKILAVVRGDSEESLPLQVRKEVEEARLQNTLTGIDCGGNLLMPGFKDAHTHSAMTFLRSSADDMPLQAWLNEQVFPYEAKLLPEDIRELSKLAILEYLTSGITCAMEMYLTPETIAEAFRDMGMRLVQVGGVNNFSQSPALLEKWYNELNGRDPLTSFRLGFHAEYTCSEELIEQIAALAHKYKAPVYTHISETDAETKGCMDRYGKTPVAFLADKGIFDYGGAGYHLVHTTEEDRDILLQKKICVVTNPGSNTKLASGIAPIAEYLKLGIPVGIGTDGPASNNCLDMFREMFLVTGLAKLSLGDAAAVPAYEVLKMATTNGARIMGLPETDCIAAGKQADLILLDLRQPNMQPVNNVASNIVYSGSKQNVQMTMVAGKILYDCFDGKQTFHTRWQPEEIYENCEKIRNRIFSGD